MKSRGSSIRDVLIQQHSQIFVSSSYLSFHSLTLSFFLSIISVSLSLSLQFILYHVLYLSLSFSHSFSVSVSLSLKFPYSTCTFKSFKTQNTSSKKPQISSKVKSVQVEMGCTPQERISLTNLVCNVDTPLPFALHVSIARCLYTELWDIFLRCSGLHKSFFSLPLLQSFFSLPLLCH